MSHNEPDPVLLPEVLSRLTTPPNLHDRTPAVRRQVQQIAWYGVGAARTLVIASVVWPRFVEVRGCVLLPWTADGVDQWWKQLGGRRREVEAILNHTHVWDLIDSQTDADDPVCIAIGRLLEETWTFAVQQFRRGYRFRLSLDPDDYGPTLYIESDADS